MLRSGWTVVGLGVLFVIVQSCGDDLGTGRIMTPGASLPEQPAAQSGERREQTASPQPATTTSPAMKAANEPQDADGGWPDYVYDDGRTYWDGGAPILLEDWHWNQSIESHRGEYGQRYVMNCIPNGSEYAVWGSNPYTDDSPVCTAGAHMGLITRELGGEVTVEIRPAQKSFEGADRNGVVGFPWGPYPGSYRVITE